MFESRRAGEAITLETAATFADGIAVKHPGDITYRMVNQYVDDIVTVSEDEIAAAILALLEKQKVIAEGAGAVTTAAVLFDKLPVRGKKVVSIGFRRKYRREYSQPGVHQRSRHQREKCQSDHRADGQAGAASGCVGDHRLLRRKCGAVYHDRSDANMAITSCYLKLGLETRDFEQIQLSNRNSQKPVFIWSLSGCENESRRSVRRFDVGGTVRSCRSKD